MLDATFYSAARDEVVRFVRDVARMPGFPTPVWALNTYIGASCIAAGKPDAVIRVVTTDRAPSQTISRSEDVWLVLQPFRDLTKTTSVAERTKLLRKRLAAVMLLVRLAASLEFELNGMSDCFVEKVDGEEAVTKQSFWLSLLRALDPHADSERHRHSERDLVVLSRTRSLRFLLAVDSDPSQIEIMDMLEEFLSADPDFEGLSQDALDARPILSPELGMRSVEIGLSFSRGRFTETSIIKLIEVLEKTNDSQRLRSDARFRVTALRFRKECLFAQKALDTLGENLGRVPTIDSLRFGDLKSANGKPGAWRTFLQPTAQVNALSRVHRLGVLGTEVFVGITSSFRTGEQNVISELDIHYDQTVENAAWLAFALFHVDSRSRVSSIRLRGSPLMSDDLVSTPQWIDVFVRTLRTLSPLGDLANIDDPELEDGAQETVGACSFVTLKPGTPAKIHPFAGAKRLCNISGEHERLGQIKNLVAVVVPGFGVGWVPVSAVIGTREQTSNLNQNGPVQINGRITSLNIDPHVSSGRPGIVQLDHRRALLQLLEIVGHPLVRLNLPNAGLVSDNLEQILRFCPNLIELNLNGNRIEDLSSLRKAYASRTCRIASLGIAMQYSSPLGNAHFQRQVTHLLQDPGSHPLRVLDATMCVSSTLEDRDSVDESLHALLRAMESHQTLDYGQLTLLWSQRCHQQRFSERVKANTMPARCQVAFLSVVNHQSNVHRNLMAELDSHVLAKIISYSHNAVRCQLVQNVLDKWGFRF